MDTPKKMHFSPSRGYRGPRLRRWHRARTSRGHTVLMYYLYTAVLGFGSLRRSTSRMCSRHSLSSPHPSRGYRGPCRRPASMQSSALQCSDAHGCLWAASHSRKNY